jgi:hypothetical protein
MVSVHVLKTLMLWLSELRSVDWWTRCNIVRTCAAVMQLLTQCYEQRRCDGYFITKVNVLECSRSETIIGHLRKFADVEFLTQWMINNYIRRCLEQCPPSVKRLLDGAGNVTPESLKRTLAAAVEWRVRRHAMKV